METLKAPQNQLCKRNRLNPPKVDTIVTGTTAKPYKLNVDKNLSKKLAATKRTQHLCIEEKDGGMVVTADAAMFELFKRAALVLYTDYPPEKGHVKVDEITDSSKKNIVQYIIRVHTPQNKGYTLNIYLTTSRLLVNGKNCSLFRDNDLQKIQDIIDKATFTEQIPNIDKLNSLIAMQINACLKQNEPKSPPKIQENDIKCVKCKKNCKSRGTFCTIGSHWVHYNCERLTNEEITRIEKSKDENYMCKICQNEPPKKVTLEIESPKKVTLEIPAIKHLSPEKTGSLMEEEIISHESSYDYDENNTCAVCGEEVESDETELCDSCESVCHKRCMVSENLCMYCHDSLEQNQAAEISLTNLSMESRGDRDPESPRPGDGVELLNGRELTCDKAKKVLKDKTASTDNIKSKLTQTNLKGHEMDLKETKLSELRSKEVKLRKLEEQLKMKEKSLEDSDKDRLKLESYIKN